MCDCVFHVVLRVEERLCVTVHFMLCREWKRDCDCVFHVV